MTRPWAAVIGIGNEYRHDDGVGPLLISALSGHYLPGVRLAVSDGEPSRLLADWAGVDLAIVVDAVVVRAPAEPGRIHRTSVVELLPQHTASSHGLGVPEAVALARALDRMPGRMVVYAVEAADVSLGKGLTADVLASVPDLVHAVLTELDGGRLTTPPATTATAASGRSSCSGAPPSGPGCRPA